MRPDNGPPPPPPGTSPEPGRPVPSVLPRIGTRRDPNRRSLVDEVVQLLRLLDLDPLLPWQEAALAVALELRPDEPVDGPRGRVPWRFGEVGLLASRQNGKTTIAEARALAGLFLFGDRILHTAQNLDLPTQSFNRLAEIVESHPRLARVSTVRRVNAAQSITVKTSGYRESSYAVLAPKPGRARGHPGISLVLIDEVREHRSSDLVEAIRPTTATRDSQVWFLSNAGGDESVVLNGLRDRGRAAVDDPDSRLAYLEFSADPDLPIDSPDAWVQGNPSLSSPLLTWDALADAYRTADPDAFRTEHLCQWLDAATETAIDPRAWDLCGRPDVPFPEGRPVFVGVELDPDRDGAAVAAALYEGETVYADAVWRGGPGSTPGEVVEAVAAVAASRRLLGIVVDPYTAGELDGLLPRGVPVLQVAGRDWLEASRRFVDQVSTGSLIHGGDPTVASEVRASGRRPYGDGSWSLTRRDSLRPIPTVLALVRAVYGALRPSVRPFIY